MMKKLVILGGGYGGIRIISKLLEAGIPNDVEITLVDRNPYHSLKTEFYTIAAGTSADKDVRVDFPINSQVKLMYGEIIQIYPDKQQIELRNNKDMISYDYLVIALGCEDNYHGIEGASQFTESVQSIKKARHTGYVVNNLDANQKVVIVGAGLSGIEVASEIRESRPDLTIQLLDRGSSVLNAFDEKIQDYVADWFEKNNVEVLHHANVESVEEGIVYNNGESLETDVIIWTAGVRPNHLVRDLPFEKDGHEKIILNEFYQVPTSENVYVVGDCAASPHSPSAQLARQQGEQIADILTAVLQDNEPKKPKDIKLKGALGSLGKSDGFGNMYNQPMTGYLPRLAKSGVLWLNKRH